MEGMELVSKLSYRGPAGCIPKFMQPGETLLILECQERILDFLVSCAKGILRDLGDELALINGPPQPEPPTVSEAETGVSSLPQLTAERPYRPAAHLSFARIASIMGAKRDACEDQLWQIREDPSYFERVALDQYEHREELLCGFDREPHALFQQRPPRIDLIWAKVIGS